jgi:hypothetical protein
VGTGTEVHDTTRGEALFLVVSVELTEQSGPEDVCPGNHRLSREIHCVRLSPDMRFSPGPERIRFALDEPMSVARPKEGSIEVLGFTELPISWDEATQPRLGGR